MSTDFLLGLLCVGEDMGLMTITSDYIAAESIYSLFRRVF